MSSVSTGLLLDDDPRRLLESWAAGPIVDTWVLYVKKLFRNVRCAVDSS